MNNVKQLPNTLLLCIASHALWKALIIDTLTAQLSVIKDPTLGGSFMCALTIDQNHRAFIHSRSFFVTPRCEGRH